MKYFDKDSSILVPAGLVRSTARKFFTSHTGISTLGNIQLIDNDSTDVGFWQISGVREGIILCMHIYSRYIVLGYMCMCINHTYHIHINELTFYNFALTGREGVLTG